jgi:hypothetical protein
MTYWYYSVVPILLPYTTPVNSGELQEEPQSPIY